MHSDVCSSCYCCSVCASICGCEEDIKYSKGIFKLLNLSIPHVYNDVKSFITAKKREELEESEESDQNRCDSDTDLSSGEDTDTNGSYEEN